MKRLYVFNGALVIIGLSLGLPAAQSLIVGDHSIPVLLMALGGGGMIVSAGYESLRTDPEEFTISAAALFALVGAACLSLLGTLLSAVSSL
jgi:Na+/citrate or Na+/malate symporter